MNYLFVGSVKRFGILLVLGCVLLMILYVSDFTLEAVTSKFTLSGHQEAEDSEDLNSLHGDTVYAHEYKDSAYGRFDVINAKFHFLKNFKSPCFLEKLPDKPPPSGQTIYTNSAYLRFQNYTKWSLFGGRVSNHMISYPQGVLIKDEHGICGKQGKCRVRCFPYFMLLGMAKSGTSDFYTRMKSHPLAYPGCNKELFYWSQYRFQISATLGDLSDLFDKNLAQVIENPYKNPETGADYYPYAFGDFTSVTFTDDVWWREHPGNKGLMEPKYLRIHDMYRVLPNVKLIAILRNPSTRLYSSYNMFRRGRNEPSPEDFHLRVVKSIEWWHNCTVVKGLPRRRCAYGSPPEMPPVVCVLKGKAENNRWYGTPNVANYSGEIRRGMYPIFVKDWYSVYPKEQILLIKTEEYSKDPLNIFNDVVLPFLDLPQVEQTEGTGVAKESHSNSRSYLPMMAETRKLLDDFYKPFNEELAEFLGDDKWLWKD